jgi:hypothetical protein
MSKGRHLFREAEIRRAVKAAQSAGMKIARVEIDNTGKISLIPGDRGASVEPEKNEWENIK